MFSMQRPSKIFTQSCKKMMMLRYKHKLKVYCSTNVACKANSCFAYAAYIEHCTDSDQTSMQTII